MSNYDILNQVKLITYGDTEEGARMLGARIYEMYRDARRECDGRADNACVLREMDLGNGARIEAMAFEDEYGFALIAGGVDVTLYFDRMEIRARYGVTLCLISGERVVGLPWLRGRIEVE